MTGTAHPLPTPEQLAALAHPEVTLHDLARLARQVNAANGWGLTFTFHDVPGYVALIHSEIVEADRELQIEPRNRELGDVIVRAMDLAELLLPGELALRGWDPGHPQSTTLPRHLLELHGHATDVLELYRKEPDEAAREQMVTLLQVLVLDAAELIAEYGGHPRQVVAEIITKNAGRGHRHGGRRT